MDKNGRNRPGELSNLLLQRHESLHIRLQWQLAASARRLPRVGHDELRVLGQELAHRHGKSRRLHQDLVAHRPASRDVPRPRQAHLTHPSKSIRRQSHSFGVARRQSQDVVARYHAACLSVILSSHTYQTNSFKSYITVTIA